MKKEEIKKTVREGYAKVAKEIENSIASIKGAGKKAK